MVMHFWDPEDLTKYQDMHDWSHLDESGSFSPRRGISFSWRKKTKALHKTPISYNKGYALVCCCEASIQPLFEFLVGWQIGNLAYWGLGTS